MSPFEERLGTNDSKYSARAFTLARGGPGTKGEEWLGLQQTRPRPIPKSSSADRFAMTA